MFQTKRTKVFGEWLIETDEPETLEQPPTSDFWEGPQFEVSPSWQCETMY